jgi:hypothetical protein
MTNQSFFITGTDTNVGKTTMTAALILALQQQRQSVGVFKPLETGVDVENHEHSDTERLRHLLSPPPSFDSDSFTYARTDSTVFIPADRRSRRHFHTSYPPTHHTRLGHVVECSLFDRRKHKPRRRQPLPAHIRGVTASRNTAVRYRTQ